MKPPIRSRIRIVVLLACGALLVSGSASGSGAPAPRDGAYDGRTDQGRRITLFVAGGKVLEHVRIEVIGETCHSFAWAAHRRVPVSRQGTFVLTSGGIVVRGRFASDVAVRGTIADRRCLPAGRRIGFVARWTA